MIVGERFVKAMEIACKTKRFGADLAREYKKSPQAISQLKKLEKTSDLMRRIAKDKSISLPWLEFGEGEMFERGTNLGKESYVSELPLSYGESVDISYVVALMQKMDERQRKEVVKMVLKLIETDAL